MAIRYPAVATRSGTRRLSACPWPSREPSTATPSAPPDCRAAFRTPLATPACSRPAAPTTAAVMAGMASEIRPISSEPARISASGVLVPAVASSAVPAAARASPAIIGGRGPNRAVSRPLASEPAPTNTLLGSSSSPVASTDSCRACCR